MTPDYFASIRRAESGGNDAARNPRSSATGRYQFIDSTWRGLMQQYPELGLTADGRTDPAQQERAIQAFTRDNAAVLQGAGIDPTPANLYAAHFLGAGGATQVLAQPDTASLESLLPSSVIRANPNLRGMTVADFRAMTARAGGGLQPLSFGNVAPTEGVLPLNMGEAVEPENKWGILAEIGRGLMPQQQAAPQLMPFTPTPYRPEQRDRLAPYMQFFQTLG